MIYCPHSGRVVGLKQPSAAQGVGSGRRKGRFWLTGSLTHATPNCALAALRVECPGSADISSLRFSPVREQLSGSGHWAPLMCRLTANKEAGCGCLAPLFYRWLVVVVGPPQLSVAPVLMLRRHFLPCPT